MLHDLNLDHVFQLNFLSYDYCYDILNNGYNKYANISCQVIYILHSRNSLTIVNMHTFSNTLVISPIKVTNLWSLL